MTCHELQDAYELYALGVLEGEEKAEIDAHLARGCEECRKGLAEARAMNAALLSFVPEEYPSARLKRRVMEGIGVRHPGWGWLGALAAALMLIVALWLAVQERETSRRLLFDEYGELCGRRAGSDQAPEIVRPSAQMRARAFSGVHVISPRLLTMIEEEGIFSIIATYLRLAGQGEKIRSFPADEYYWRDLGKAENLAQAERDVEQKVVEI